MGDQQSGTNVADDDDEEEDVTDEHLDYLNQKDVIVSAAAKLIAHEIVPRVQISFPFSFCCNCFVVHSRGVMNQYFCVLLSGIFGARDSFTFCDAWEDSCRNNKAYAYDFEKEYEERRAFKLVPGGH